MTNGSTAEEVEEWREVWAEYTSGPGSLAEEAPPDEGDGEDEIQEVL